jgi:3-phenylpropionate/trans-cinnamate dioxygenase ferredoxin reductase component
MAQETHVIVGASLAGAKAAETLRTEGFDGRILLIGEEPVPPYERPPLSKAYLRGEVDFDSFAVHPADFYGDHEIELLTSTTATSIDAEAKTVTLDDDSVVAYSQLLLATGASPRTLTIPGAELAGIHYLRSIASCDSLRDALGVSERLVVIGGGWIGSEVAASARQLGLDVTIVEPFNVLLERVLGTEVGELFGDLHREHGVELRMGTGVESFRGGHAAEEVVLSDGSVVAGDLFVVGVGALPRTELASTAGVELDNGVVVDEHLASSVPGIWAAGDVANAFHPVLGRRFRLEHWSAALNQGPVAAKNMLGLGIAYEKVPYFYSDQYELGMEYSGLATEWDQIVYRGDRVAREVVVFWMDRGKVAAGMNVNVWDVADQIAALVAAQRTVDVPRLEDPSISLADVLMPSRA